MKVVWIVLGALFALGLLCCSGVFLFGRGLFNSIAETNDQADRFATKVVKELGADWDPTILKSYGSPEFKTSVSNEELALRMKNYAERLGSLKSCEPFTAINTSSNYYNGNTLVTVHTQAKVKFEKGTGTVDVSVQKEGAASWSVVTFEISSDALVQ